MQIFKMGQCISIDRLKKPKIYTTKRDTSFSVRGSIMGYTKIR